MSLTEAYAEFDLCGPLPSGVTVLEASAGTGKTYTIAELAARYVAEGLPLERMLLITFTRMATGELRDRVRERLVSTERELARIAGGAALETDDPIVNLLAQHDLEGRRARLARAVADFDAATIATTHGFCQEVLAELGTVGDLDPDTAFVEDVSDLLEQALDDLYVRQFAPARARGRGGTRLTRGEALKIASAAAVRSPMAALEPQDEPADSVTSMRYRLAKAVREELEQRKRRLAIMTYEDLLIRLNETLDGPSGAAAKARLSERFEVVLVDEFQDTDPTQWQILRRAFATQGVTLVLIADPKQAIYAFRGADVYAYLNAAKEARTHRTLRENRRSDQPLLDAYDALFDGARLGHEEIVYRQVRAASEHQTAALPGPALRVRVVHRDEPTIERTFNGYAKTDTARAHIAKDVAADIVRTLDAQAPQICPGDIAVLVRTHTTAHLVSDELHAAGVPAVVAGGGSVFGAPAARHWLRLLEALERPSFPLRARTAAPTPFLNWSAEQIATADEAQWESAHRRLHGWSRVLRESGVAALTEAIMAGEGLAARMLALTGGERWLTDMRHVAQLLHRAGMTERLGTSALRAWLAERVADTEGDEGEEERARRLESDAEAVQVLTIHRSKGLEFPIVYCPFLWDPSRIRKGEPVAFHDPAMGNRHTLDVGLEGRTYDAHVRRHLIEQRGEDLRLAYVALTRAKHQAVIWWAGSRDSRDSPLGRLLFAKDPDGNVKPFGAATPSDDAVERRLAELVGHAAGAIAAERSTLSSLPSVWSPPQQPPVSLEAARFERRLDLRWRRTSYSDITADAHEEMVASEPEEPNLADEPERPAPALVANGAEGSVPGLDRVSPLAEMPVGTRFGTFVHGVLEATDFEAADLDQALAEQSIQRWPFDAPDPAACIPGLRAAIETPLGPLADDRRLRDIPRTDRLDELEFELPLVGGDEPTGRLTLSTVADALQRHLPAGDPMHEYATRLRDPALRSSVRGFLTGSIDLVLRLEGPRFAIVDYKTNWLGPAGEALTLRHYQPAALAAEMSRAHYGLQALLYTVALHRYLRWRMPRYDPDRHLSGVLYLFVRGMAGAETPVIDGSPCGVYAWRPAAPVVAALSEVLDLGSA